MSENVNISEVHRRVPETVVRQLQTLLPVNKSFEPSAAPPLQYEVSHQESALRYRRVYLLKDPL
jgi:hypothetical protein